VPENPGTNTMGLQGPLLNSDRYYFVVREEGSLLFIQWYLVFICTRNKSKNVDYFHIIIFYL